jgi:hypothetical protein
MSEQQVDTDALRSLTETLTSLVEYTGALRDGAGGFAYMLPSEWQGPAMTQAVVDRSRDAAPADRAAAEAGRGGPCRLRKFNNRA